MHTLNGDEGHRKRSIAFWLLLAEFLFIPVKAVPAEAANSLPKPTDYVNDYAHVLSPEGATRLDRICMELNHSQANAQFAIVTVHTLDGDDAADYASQLEDRWKIGKKGSDRGVLVLLAVDDHKWRIRNFRCRTCLRNGPIRYHQPVHSDRADETSRKGRYSRSSFADDAG